MLRIIAFHRLGVVRGDVVKLDVQREGLRAVGHLHEELRAAVVLGVVLRVLLAVVLRSSVVKPQVRSG
eukprot:1922893-Heterocapsa_arctica.AAC.1